jgi:NADH-quinone oxidoreductase subunit C
MPVEVKNGAAVVDSLCARYGDAVRDRGCYGDQHWATITADRWVEICTVLQEDPEFDFDQLLDITAVHWPDDPAPFEIVVHLYSYTRNDRLRLRVRLAESEAIPTLSGIWSSANWNERETFDMFGIKFSGHPDLRRILMPDDYTDYPLRKEFPLYSG